MTAKAGEAAQKTGTFHCADCGRKVRVEAGSRIPDCPACGFYQYDERTDEPGGEGPGSASARARDLG